MIFYLLACVALATASPAAKPTFLGNAHSNGARIVGGSDANYGEFPWQATLQRSTGSHFCGASLITSRHVMTASHCYVSGTRVGLGALDYRYPEQLISMATFTGHPFYNSQSLDYDYAVITLSSAAVLGGNVQTIQLVAAGQEYSGTASVSGWGYDTRIGQSTPVIMKKTNLPLVSKADCQRTWGSFITDRMQCVAGDGLVSVCSGDSGGPLTVQDNGQTILIGAASWAESTCNPAYPGGYAKLSAVRDWIDGIIN